MPLPWRALYNLFDPIKKLDGDQLRLFVARDPRQLEKAQNDFRLSDSPLHALLVGQRGTGKSSELRYLAEQLKDDFLTVVIDVDELTDLFNVNHVEVLYLIGASVFASARLKGLSLPDALLEDLGRSIQTLINTHTEAKDFAVPVKEILAAIGTAVATAAAGSLAAGVFVTAASIFKELKFNLGVSDSAVRKIEVKPRITEISRAIERIVEATERAAGRKLLLIVDGLDRVDFDQARQIFAESGVLNEPTCHIVYVIPAHLYYSPYLNQAKQIFSTVYPLPNVKLHARSGAEHAPGYALLREVVRKRLAEPKVHLAVDEVFAPEALKMLIENSGGMLREFIRLLQNAVREAILSNGRVELQHAKAAVDALRREYIAGVTPPLLAELVHVLEKNMPSGSPQSAVALQNQYILSQTNGDIWYEVHPVIASYVNAEWMPKT